MVEMNTEQVVNEIEVVTLGDAIEGLQSYGYTVTRVPERELFGTHKKDVLYRLTLDRKPKRNMYHALGLWLPYDLTELWRRLPKGTQLSLFDLGGK